MAAPMEGELLKRGSARSLFGRKSWKRRYFVLDEDGCLQYYKSKADFERDPDSRLKGRRIAVRSVHAEQHDVGELGSMPPGEHADRGLVLESDDGSVTLRVCGTDKDHETATTTWIRALKAAGADAPGVPPLPPARVRPVTPPGEPESGRLSAAAIAAEEAEAELAAAEAAAVASEVPSPAPPAPPAQPAATDSPAAPPPPPPAAPVPTDETGEQASAGQDADIEVVEVADGAAEAEQLAESDGVASGEAGDVAEAAGDASASSVEAPEASSDDAAGPAAEAAASSPAEEELDSTYATMDLEVIEERLAEELAAMAPPPEDRDDSDLQDATPANLQAVYEWMDVNKDGAIQVVEFAKATSGKHRESLLACGKSLADLSTYKIPGSAMKHTDFQKMSLFQTLDTNGDTVISSTEWRAAFEGTDNQVFLGWMRDILRQLRDIDQGFRPTSRSEAPEGE